MSLVDDTADRRQAPSSWQEGCWGKNLQAAHWGRKGKNRDAACRAPPRVEVPEKVLSTHEKVTRFDA